MNKGNLFAHLNAHFLIVHSFCASGGQINYRKLYDVLGATNEYTHKSTRHVDVEHWIDDVPASKNPSEKWATMPGSVGEWLFKAACPSEIANFKRFISCLERFERESGMKIQLTPGGLILNIAFSFTLIYYNIIIYNIGNFKVPLGPDLQASIKFNMG